MSTNHTLQQFLTDLGLTQTEQQLYLVGLGITDATVEWLVQHTNVNRTTAYHALGTLEQKGFCRQAKQQGRLVYTMAKPEELDAVFSAKEAQLSRQKMQLRELGSLFPTAEVSSADEVSAEQYKSEAGVKQAIEKALYCKSRQWNIIAPKDNFFSQTDPAYAKYFMDTRRERGITARTLWETNEDMSKLSLRDLQERKPRYLPPQFSKRFKSVVILFDNKALFIASTKKHSAILLESEEMVGTLNTLFEALWTTADKPFRDH